MASQEEISNQLMLLQTHRQTLVYLLKQEAIFGGAHTPVHILHNIRQTREHIRDTKKILELLNVPVEDEPNDEEMPTLPFILESYQSNQFVSLRGKIEVAQVSDAAVPGASGVYYYLILERAINITPDDIALQIKPDATNIRLNEIQVMANRVEHVLKNLGHMPPDLGKVGDRKVVISGQLIPRHTGHHRTPYILFADSIEIR